MRFVFLLILLLIPALGGGNVQLLKTALLAIGVLIFARAPHIGFSKAGQKVFWLGLIVLGCALISTVTVSGPLWGWSEGFIGKADRVEGWLCLASVFVFAWFACWNGVEKEKECFAVSLLALTVVIGLIWSLWGLDGLRVSVGGWLGVGALVSLCIPVVLAWGWNQGEESSPSRRWATAGACGLGAVLLVVSGCRSALLGLVVGLFLMVLLSEEPRRLFRAKKNWLRYGALSSIIAIGLLAVALPSMRARLIAINPTSFGTGARSTVVMQLWQAGVPLLGWGVESQGHLIETRTIPNRQNNGIYDRFHSWPADVLAVTGWLGLVACLVALWLLAKIVHENRREWWVRGFAGGLAAFLVGAGLNPPSMQMMLLAAIMAAGICTRLYPSWSSYSARRPLNESVGMVWLRWSLIGVCGVASVVYGAAVLGDRINAAASARCNNGTALPHTVMARQWMATLLNPWMQRARIETYYAFHKHRRIWEPEGGRVLLKQLLQDNQTEPALIALMYGGMEDSMMCSKWLEVAKMSAPIDGRPVDRLYGLATDAKGRVWGTMATGPGMRVVEDAGNLKMVMETKRGAGIYISMNRLFGGFAPGAACEIVARIRNPDGVAHVFLTTDPVWDKRTYAAMLDSVSHEYRHAAFADEKGVVAVRLVCEINGVVEIEDVEVRVKEEGKP